MPGTGTFVIVGASLAGAKAAETLRAEGFAGRVVLVGEEERLPYERPPLSKGLLLGSAEPESTLVHDREWYAASDVELRLGTRVTEVDAERRVVRAGDDEIAYDRLLLATGSRPRRLLGGDENVLYLRGLDDSLRLLAVLGTGGHLTIIGSGWIGLEVAAAARERGVAVTVVAPEAVPLQRVMGERIGGVFADLHREHGVDFRFGSGVQELRGSEVVLDGGEILRTDHVLVAIGAEPNVGLARRAGLAVGDGVLVDALHRTSDPAIFAAGDVAAVEHPGYGERIRVEHWANALHSGPAAALSMLGRGSPWTNVPYFFTDQYDLGMEYAGRLTPGATVVIRGDLAGRECIVFWVDHGRVVAGMNVNVWDVTDQIQDLIRAGFHGHRVDEIRLADPDVPLPELLP
ncbi:NAD(P)/FAD-dependent oxidoreductase [Actinoplanes lobatus]|uniref:Ferredoxin n=1 Tax=Actinoplanes lobatus TaxID=113568 RepID=A0A7W7MIC4_9ACTN|nr:FAD-dependent oxidoreductase [Actinoplanes lobatus]MBB4751339.1 NADPH-dependent 2,4-dienoyl-CoA reductase/sulfur reductase-like enzyme [Actinoplanes lobatus]GIE40948.1 ferredoxin [Actinoplanes lobatus]